MHILITGGTGLIGTQLCRYLTNYDYKITVWSRNPKKVSRTCEKKVRGVHELEDLGEDHVDVIVNLAGAPIANKLWTKKRKSILYASRVMLTNKLCKWIESRKTRPSVLISGSAIGWYGNGRDQKINEKSTVLKRDFPHYLCESWENSAQQAKDLGIRVVLLRTGLVLSLEGGFFPRLLLPFRIGLGGNIGNGRQWMPWIHIHDLVAIIDYFIHNKTSEGHYNICAPNPVRNIEFSKILAKKIGRPSFITIPATALILLLGELSQLLLQGQRAFPEKLVNSGFKFKFNRIDEALDNLCRHK